MAKIDVPTLVIHGDADRIVPFAAAGQRTAKLINGAELVVIKDGPHNVAWTHADEVNSALTTFLAKPGPRVSHRAPKNESRRLIGVRTVLCGTAALGCPVERSSTMDPCNLMRHGAWGLRGKRRRSG